MPAENPVKPGPARWERLPEGYEAWLVTRYDDVRAALTDTRLTRNMERAMSARAAAGLPTWRSGRGARGTTLLECDPPEHTMIRKAINPEFTLRRVTGVRSHVEQIANDLMDRFCQRGVADLVEEFTLPLTVSTLCAFVGIPFRDWHRFHVWVRDVHVVDLTPEGMRRTAAASLAMDTYFEELVAARRDRTDRRSTSDPDRPVLTRLIDAGPDGGFDEDDLLAMARSLLVGGYESTNSLIVTGVLALLVHRAQMEKLKADPDRIPSAVEEFLRYDPPFPRLQERYALEDLQIGDVTISQGEPVVIDLAAANRDTDRFGNPNEFDAIDPGRGHLSFGPGIHHCLGASLARMEAEVAVRSLLARLPRLRMNCDPESLEWPVSIISGPRTLPVRFTPSEPIAATAE